MGPSPIIDGPRWGAKEGTRLLEDVSGGHHDHNLYNHDHGEGDDHEDAHMMRDLFQKNVVDFIRIRGNLADTYSDDEIHRAIGILR